MTTFPRIYEDAKCPLDGYEGYAFRVLVNPTGAEKTDWTFGHLGADGCEACARLNTPRGKPKDSDPPKKYCDDCTRARDQMGRASAVIYGTSHTEGFDFSTPAAALATFSDPDLPDELKGWLFWFPSSLWAARLDEIKKKLPGFSPTGS